MESMLSVIVEDSSIDVATIHFEWTDCVSWMGDGNEKSIAKQTFVNFERVNWFWMSEWMKFMNVLTCLDDMQLVNIRM
jgi:hypothetical protein